MLSSSRKLKTERQRAVRVQEVQDSLINRGLCSWTAQSPSQSNALQSQLLPRIDDDFQRTSAHLAHECTDLQGRPLCVAVLMEDSDDRVLQWCYTQTTGIIVLPTCFLIALLVYFLGRHH
jgi:hypothetical protein